jgi:hypothetical protein
MAYTTRREVIHQLLAGTAAIGVVPALGLFAKSPARHLYWLAYDGQAVFPMYGISGGLASNLCAVLVDKIVNDGGDVGRHGLHEERGGRWYVIEFGYDEDEASAQKKIDEAVRALS